MDEGMKALIRRYYHEVWEMGNAAAQQQLLADDYLDHDPTPGFAPTKEGAIQLAAAMAGSMRDVHMDVEDIIVEGDRAAAHWRMSWTQRGSFLGAVADGRQLQLHGHDFYRVSGQQIAEIWHCEDFLGVMLQLGAVPSLG